MTVHMEVAPAAAPPPATPSPVATTAPAPSPVPTPSVADGRAQVVAFLAARDASPCFFARFVDNDSLGRRFVGMGDDRAAFDSFAADYKKAFQRDPEIRAELVTPGQCPVVELMKLPAASAAPPPRLTLDSATVGSGRPLSGAVTELAQRSMILLAVGDDGRAVKVRAQIGDDGQSASFSLGITGDAASVGKPQLLVALVSDRPFTGLDTFRAGASADLIRKIEAQWRDAGAAATAVAVQADELTGLRASASARRGRSRSARRREGRARSRRRASWISWRSSRTAPLRYWRRCRAPAPSSRSRSAYSGPRSRRSPWLAASAALTPSRNGADFRAVGEHDVVLAGRLPAPGCRRPAPSRDRGSRRAGSRRKRRASTARDRNGRPGTSPWGRPAGGHARRAAPSRSGRRQRAATGSRHPDLPGAGAGARRADLRRDVCAGAVPSPRPARSAARRGRDRSAAASRRWRRSWPRLRRASARRRSSAPGSRSE